MCVCLFFFYFDDNQQVIKKNAYIWYLRNLDYYGTVQYSSSLNIKAKP